MFLQDFKAGDRVGIYVDKENVLKDAEHTSDDIVPCYIIRFIYCGDITVGWKEGDLVPLPNSYASINHDKSFPGFVAWAKLNPVRNTSGLVSMDGPCRQCSKTNSSQDKKCWWCQVSCPTDLKRTGP